LRTYFDFRRMNNNRIAHLPASAWCRFRHFWMEAE
jgi:hypothetical protein